MTWSLTLSGDMVPAEGRIWPLIMPSLWRIWISTRLIKPLEAPANKSLRCLCPCLNTVSLRMQFLELFYKQLFNQCLQSSYCKYHNFTSNFWGVIPKDLIPWRKCVIFLGKHNIEVNNSNKIIDSLFSKRKRKNKDHNNASQNGIEGGPMVKK